MLTEKAIVICLLEILRKYSDEKHIMTRSEIVGKMRLLYGLEPDRRTIYGAIGVLTDVGYDISTYEDNKKGYFLQRDPSTDLDSTEAQLLSDAICAFPFISRKQTEQLVKKVHNMVSVHEQKSIKNMTIVKNDKKTDNREVFFNIAVLDEAIEKKVKVKFDYMEYHADLELHKRREKKYTMNPYGMVYMNDRYYLICSMAYQERINLYRIDRMKNIELTTYELDDRGRDFSPKAAVENATHAYAGEPEHIEMLVDPKGLDGVIDQYGRDIFVHEVDDGRLKVSFNAPAGGVKYWAMQYLEQVELIKPEHVRQEIIDMLVNNRYIDPPKES